MADHFLGLDTSFLEMNQKGRHHLGIDGAMHQLITHQPITIGCGRINGQQQRQVILVDLVYTKGCRRLAYHPGLVISLEVEASTVVEHTIGGSSLRWAAPTNPGPSVLAPGASLSHHGKPPRRLFQNHAAAVGSVSAKKAWLSPEVVGAGQTTMDTDGDGKHDGLIKIKVHRDPLGSTVALCGTSTAITR